MGRVIRLEHTGWTSRLPLDGTGRDPVGSSGDRLLLPPASRSRSLCSPSAFTTTITATTITSATSTTSAARGARHLRAWASRDERLLLSRRGRTVGNSRRGCRGSGLWTRRQQWPPPEWRRCGQVGAVARAQGEAEGEEAGRGRRGQATAAEVYDWHPPAAASALRPRLGPPPHMAARREQPPPEATEGSGLVHPLRPSVALLAPELVSRPRRHVDAGRHLRRAHRSAVLGHRLGGRWRREDCGLPPAREPLRGSEAEATVLLPGVAGAGRVPSARRGTVRGPETFGAARPWCTPLVYGPSGCRRSGVQIPPRHRRDRSRTSATKSAGGQPLTMRCCDDEAEAGEREDDEV
ncbi:unnamed protein product [Prorocentrum cordatum]|uniref:Uncharacterized protein n=1 Tax=Prorocentrum cordatum TaxID=2364126 RepID=A0ABN9UF86_9DINO|nr:unnamed protein product [Polarella glacialis]